MPSLRRAESSKRRTRSAPTSGRRDIQGLRALAVVAVILDHLARWPKAGFVGVDVFFVISGFLITGLLLREHERTGAISYRGFYARRARRILPAALLVLGVTLGSAWLLFGHRRFVSVAADVGWSALFSGNWRFAVQGTEYFNAGLPPSPVQHFWSLGVEEQFYFVWPWLMLAILAVSARFFRGRAGRGRWSVAAVIVAITAASFLWGMHQTSTDAAFAYFSSLTRAWELGVGATLAVVAARLTRQPTWLRVIVGWVGFAGILYSMWVVPDSHGFPAPWAALPVGATALVIASGIGEQRQWLWPLTNPLSTYLGDISYSLYLWHFPVIVLSVALITADTSTFYTVCGVLIAVLAMLSYHLVEDPIRRGSSVQPAHSRQSRRITSTAVYWRALFSALATVTIVFLVIGAIQGPPAPPADELVAPSLAAAGGATDAGQEGPKACLGAAATDTSLKCDESLLKGVVLPAPDRVADDVGESFRCYAQKGAPMKTCSYGDPAGTRVALVGDSHAASLIPGLVAAATAAKWHLDVFVGNGCQLKLPINKNCDRAMPDIQRALLGNSYEVVITSARRVPGLEGVAQQYSAAWKPLLAKGVKLVVIGDNPLMPEEGLQCIQRLSFSVDSSHCGASRSEATSIPDPLIRAVELTPGAALVDLTRIYCDDKTCPAVIGHVLVYRDSAGHLTGTFSKTLGPYLLAEVRRAARL